MQLHLSEDDVQFRGDLRAYFEAAPEELRAAVRSNRELSRDQVVEGMRFLNAAGLAVPHWPLDWGGRDWSPLRHHLWHLEVHRACLPRPSVLNGNLVGPVIFTFGNQGQKERFLPATANMDIWWCQGFSEPGSGSDLASVRTTATLDGDEFVVNGQKTWTTTADLADWIFLLVRTDPSVKKQRGISFLLADMRSPGITVRPIELIDGSHEVCDVFFDDVRVPANQLIGEMNRGWDYAKSLLGAERANTAPIGQTKRWLAQAKSELARAQEGAGPTLADPWVASRLADLENELAALELTLIRAQTDESDKDSSAVSILKLRATELEQAVSELLVDVVGARALLVGDPAVISPSWSTTSAPTYLNNRKASIYGGSSEVQRQIIAKSILGL